MKYFLYTVAFVFVALLVFLGIKQKNADDKLKEEIGQMLIFGFRGTEANPDSYIAKALKDIKPGGVILFDIDVPSGRSFPRNIENPEQTKRLVSDLKKMAPAPIFVAIDVEGGKVNRLKSKYGFSDFLGAQELGDIDNINETVKMGEDISAELEDLGINLNFAPVVDVNINKQNPVIGAIGRSFSDDPEKVYENASAFITGLHKNNIVSSLKHFPGHGSSASDSHLGFTDITNTYQQEELIPYEKLIEEGSVDMIMTAHVVNQNIDPAFPATLSSKYINDILRDKFKFQGVVVSDDMQMGAITENYGYEEAIIRAVNAGCDLLIISNNGSEYNEKAPYRARDIIFEAVKRGEIQKDGIEDSYNRIIKLKRKFEI